MVLDPASLTVALALRFAVVADAQFAVELLAVEAALVPVEVA